MTVTRAKNRHKSENPKNIFFRYLYNKLQTPFGIVFLKINAKFEMKKMKFAAAIANIIVSPSGHELRLRSMLSIHVMTIRVFII